MIIVEKRQVDIIAVLFSFFLLVSMSSVVFAQEVIGLKSLILVRTDLFLAIQTPLQLNIQSGE